MWESKSGAGADPHPFRTWWSLIYTPSSEILPLKLRIVWLDPFPMFLLFALFTFVITVIGRIRIVAQRWVWRVIFTMLTTLLLLLAFLFFCYWVQWRCLWQIWWWKFWVQFHLRFMLFLIFLWNSVDRVSSSKLIVRVSSSNLFVVSVEYLLLVMSVEY